MPDREQEANERLRQAQEVSRQAEENVRQAQEGVRETREKKGSESRVEAETGRVGAEGERVTAGAAAAKAEEGRVTAEEGRVAAGKKAIAKASSHRSKDKTEFYVIYALLFMAGIFAALWGEHENSKLEEATNQLRMTQKQVIMGQQRLVMSEREGCERLNIVRKNQGGILQDEINESQRLLENPEFLKQLASFAANIEESIENNKQRQKRIEESINHGLSKKGTRFEIDCVKAYPLPKIDRRKLK